MIVDLITIFPAMVDAVLAEGVLGRARERGLVEIRVRDLREYADDRHRTVDDVPYGGGPGMVMKPEPLFRAVEAIQEDRGPASAVLLMTPQGVPFTHRDAERWSRLDRLVMICGRYEGIDERVTEALVTDEVSIGDYVLTGGELPALVVLDAMARFVPGVVGDAASVTGDSFVRGLLDHPHYTRPARFRDREVPEVLLSGHHAEIERWRACERVKRTLARRPDMIDRAVCSDEERRELERLLGEHTQAKAPVGTSATKAPRVRSEQ
jgi:tRNA (guanine37-N1)-methyltransferase